MKTPILVALFLLTTHLLVAQETVKQKEIGFAFSSLNQFGLTYRTGTNKAMWRSDVLFVSGSNLDVTNDDITDTRSNIGFGVALGREYRKPIADHLALRLGADLSFNYDKSESEFDDKTRDNDERFTENTTYEPGIRFVFGFNYDFNNAIVIGVELLPSVSYTTGTRVERVTFQNIEETATRDISGLSYGFSNTSARLSLVYRF